MAPHGSEQQLHLKKMSAKAAYSKSARNKLVESRAKLDGIRTAIKQAVAAGRLRPSEQLDRTLSAMEVNFRAAETQLRNLQKSGEDEWEKMRVQLDSTWENLARSIANLVARFSDESRD